MHVPPEHDEAMVEPPSATLFETSKRHVQQLFLFPPSPSRNTTRYCSFCGNSGDEVKKLLAGPTAFICDECVQVFMEVLVEAGVVK